MATPRSFNGGATLGTLDRCVVSWAILPYLVHPDSLTVEDRWSFHYFHSSLPTSSHSMKCRSSRWCAVGSAPASRNSLIQDFVTICLCSDIMQSEWHLRSTPLSISSLKTSLSDLQTHKAPAPNRIGSECRHFSRSAKEPMCFDSS